ncbi:MAG: hypothetical protein PHV18_03110 [Lachnospiraceae bacterium]|nr:hypothetical protein [Lachnospiraceae bacterium]
MNNRKSGSGSGIFLMEMMMVVGFFIVCASVCILAFAKSDHLSRLAEERNQAVLAAQSLAEVWKAEDTEGLTARFGSAETNGSWMTVWDKTWQPVSETAPEAAFAAEMKITAPESGPERMSVSVWNLSGHEALFELEASCYRQTD